METGPFGLLRNPFERSAELDDGCLPNSIAALLSELQSGLRSPQGLSVLVGARGSGKSFAAQAFARRLGAVARVALLSEPTSSVSAIARDALRQIDPSDFDFAADEDWVRALHANVERRARAGRATAIVIDDAHRLSPQALGDLVRLFGEEEPLRLHVFLFGRPRLLERIEAGGAEALGAHLLQICRMEPLSLRESVRYLERRVAMCGGELAGIFSDDAIDEIVRKSEGCLIAIEEVAGGALRRAARRASTRVVAEDVMAVVPKAIVEEENPMAGRQQPIDFEISGDAREHEDDWTDGEEEASVEWALEDDDEDDGDLWHSGTEADDDLPEASALSWERSAGGVVEHDDEEEDAGYQAVFASSSSRPKANVRNRFAGRAVLSLAACLALVWTANHLPKPRSEEKHGRDAKMTTEPLSSKPEEILRLASTIEEADADAQVAVWRLQPRPAVQETVRNTAAPAVADTVEARAAVQTERPTAGGPSQLDVLRAASKRGAKETASAQPAKDKAASARPAIAEASPRGATAKATSAVYTVQLGAFKTRTNAEAAAKKVHGKPTRIIQDGGLFRVISGSFSSRNDATAHEAALKRAGYTAFVRSASF